MQFRAVTPTLNLVAVSLLGGYAFTWGFTALGITAAVALGAGFHDAETGVLLLAFLVFLVAFIWTFTVTNLTRAWVMLVGGGAAMAGIAWVLQQQLLQGV